MKCRHITCWLFLGFFAAGGTTAGAQGQKVTCQSHDGPFVLDESDFKALAQSDSKLTREKFESLDAALKRKVCDTRKLMRLIQTGKGDQCLLLHYDRRMDFVAKGAEDDKFLAWQIDGVDKKCR